jgi:transposase
MRSGKRPSELGCNRYAIPRVTKALQGRTEARLFQRLQAVLWVAQGEPFSEVAALTGVSPQPVYNWLQRYLACHQATALADAPRRGRPVTAPQLPAAPILQHLQANPLRLGSQTPVWSVKLLAAPLSRHSRGPITPATLRRRLRAMG